MPSYPSDAHARPAPPHSLPRPKVEPSLRSNWSLAQWLFTHIILEAEYLCVRTSYRTQQPPYWVGLRLRAMCAEMRWFDDSADRSDSSPQSTVEATMRASCWA